MLSKNIAPTTKLESYRQQITFNPESMKEIMPDNVQGKIEDLDNAICGACDGLTMTCGLEPGDEAIEIIEKSTSELIKIIAAMSVQIERMTNTMIAQGVMHIE